MRVDLERRLAAIEIRLYGSRLVAAVIRDMPTMSDDELLCRIVEARVNPSLLTEEEIDRILLAGLGPKKFAELMEELGKENDNEYESRT